MEYVLGHDAIDSCNFEDMEEIPKLQLKESTIFPEVVGVLKSRETDGYYLSLRTHYDLRDGFQFFSIILKEINKKPPIRNVVLRGGGTLKGVLEKYGDIERVLWVVGVLDKDPSLVWIKTSPSLEKEE